MEGASHDTAAVLLLGCSPPHKKETVAAALRRTIPAVPRGLTLRYRVDKIREKLPGVAVWVKETPIAVLRTHETTKGFITPLYIGHDAQWKMVLAASSRPAQRKRQHTYALVQIRCGNSRYVCGWSMGSSNWSDRVPIIFCNSFTWASCLFICARCVPLHVSWAAAEAGS